jgi:uncharacterized protein (DUF433 family)
MNPARIPRLFSDERSILHGGGGTQELGRFLISDPMVCGGAPVFKGTCILLWDVMAQVVGLGWNPGAIVEATGGAVTLEAIEEARQVMLKNSGHAEDEMLVTVSAEFYEGPDHFAKGRAPAHVHTAAVDRAWLKRLLQLEAPPHSLARLVVVDPDVDPHRPVFRGTRILLEDVTDKLFDAPSLETVVAHWKGAISVETLREADGVMRELLHTQVALDRPAFDKFIEETDRELNQIEAEIRESRKRQQTDPALLQAKRAWRSPRKR